MSHSTEKFCCGTLRCIRKFRVAKNFMHQRGGGGIKIFRRKFFVSQCRKFPQGIFYCCIIFRYRKSLGKRRGGVSRFSVEIFCLTVPKISVGESFTVALISGIEKVWVRGGGGEYQDFPSKFFVSQCPKTS